MQEKYGYSKYFRRLQIIADFVFINCFYFFVLEHIGFLGDFSLRTIIDFNLIWAVSVLAVNPYVVYRHSGFVKLVKRQLLVLFLFLALLSVFITHFFGISEFGVIRYAKILLTFAVLFLLWKFALILIISWYRRLGWNRRNFIVIGTGEMVDDFVKELTERKALGYHHLESVHVSKNDKRKDFFEKIVESIKKHNPHVVYISLPNIRESFLNELVSKLEDERITVRIILDFKSSMARKGELEFIDYIPVLNFSSDPLG